MQVLLVDDHAEVRSMLRVALGMRPGLKIVGEAASLAEAVDKAGKLRPEAIVLDLVLPDSGAEDRVAFEAVRDAAPPTSEVIIYSAWDVDRAWYEQQGVRFFGKASDALALLADSLDS